MSHLSCRDAELSLGSLAVGALEVEARADVGDHLAVCPICTATLAELEELAALLGRVSATEAEMVLGGSAPQPLPPLDLPNPAPAPAPGPRRVRRRPVAVVSLLGAAMLAAFMLIAAPFASEGPPADRLTQARATDPQTHVRASVTMQPVEVGTELTLRLSGVPTRQACQLVVVGNDGRRSVASSWLATYAGTAEVTGTTSLSRSQIAQLVVATPDGRVLVTLPVRG